MSNHHKFKDDLDFDTALFDNPNTVHAVSTILRFLGENTRRDGLTDTPRRVLKAYWEQTWGLRVPEDEFLTSLARDFEVHYDQMIAVSKIRFTSLCEHHLLPFFGHATVSYIPSIGHNRIIGISKLARLVEYYAARPQVQERMTKQIADALQGLLDPHGVGVHITAQHLCMEVRGVKSTGALTTTNDLRGCIRDDAKARQEFLELARTNQRG